NRNVPNGVTTILGVIGGLPAGTPAAFEAAFGWWWLVELLEDYGPPASPAVACSHESALDKLIRDRILERAGRRAGERE
ncbi:MAG TPA: hypothetical protein VIV12_08980, partial [Streptosporangiaceae bacterium]